MDNQMLAAMFQALPEDKQLQALSAAGVKIDRGLVQGDPELDALSFQDQDYSWKDEEIPVSGVVKKPKVFDRDKVFPLNVPKLAAKDGIYSAGEGHDPELEQFAMIHNAQGGM